MGQISWRIKWAHTGGCPSWLPGCCGPTQIYRKEWRICIKDQRKHFAWAAKLLLINSAGPHVVVVRQRIAQSMGQRDSMGQISWRIKWGHTGGCASWLPGFCRPTRIDWQEWCICIKGQCEYFASATNLLPMDSVGPRIVLV